ncbi:MAG: hypothetical protein CTY23_08640 [Methylomonas sp.]|nr:MAG: hypothetical protein CTY23_08640 [Methylomonas sp.]
MVSFYRTAIGIGCYYAVFICTQIISAERIKYLIYVTVITSLICIALQSYLISTKNADLIIKFTPWYQNPVNAELLRTNFLANQMPRVFPNGTTAIAMLSGFSLVKALTAKKTKSILIYAALYGVFTLFLMSTGTRGFVFASVVTLSYALFAVRNQIKLSRKFALMLMTPILGLGLIYFILTSDLFGTLMARTEQLQAAKYQDAGFLSKIYQANVALRIIMENPFGIGLTRPIELEHHLRDSMWDTNSFLVMGFVGGLPAMISLIWFLISIYKKYRANLIKSTGDNAVDLIACSAALLYIFIMTAASFVFTFTTTEAIIQLCLFAGFVCKNRLSQKLTIQRLKLNKNLARSPS